MENLYGNLKKKLKKIFKRRKLNWNSPTPSFYSADIWRKAYDMHKDKVEKGISLYGEIVGEGIQGADYTYGFQYEIFIYRITQTNVDGITYELSWEAVKNYCNKYGLKYVDEYFVGKVSDFYKPVAGDEGEFDLLEVLKDKYLDKSFDDCQVDEGVCIRVRGTDEIYKLKSPRFLIGESAELEKGIENES